MLTFPPKNYSVLYAQVVGVLRSYPGHDSEEFSHSDYDIKVSKLIFIVIFQEIVLVLDYRFFSNLHNCIKVRTN